eukprot:2803-Heterococcus_DN1.PRE.1
MLRVQILDRVTHQPPALILCDHFWYEHSVATAYSSRGHHWRQSTTHPVLLREDAGNVARLLALATVALYAGVSSNLGLAQPVCTSTAAALSVMQQVITTAKRDLQTRDTVVLHGKACWYLRACQRREPLGINVDSCEVVPAQAEWGIWEQAATNITE